VYVLAGGLQPAVLTRINTFQIRAFNHGDALVSSRYGWFWVSVERERATIHSTLILNSTARRLSNMGWLMHNDDPLARATYAEQSARTRRDPRAKGLFGNSIFARAKRRAGGKKASVSNGWSAIKNQTLEAVASQMQKRLR
jgi:hypothetical protein